MKTRDFLFRLSGDVVAHHQAVKLSWEMVPANGSEVAGAGVIFLLLRDDGRIHLDYQF
jgi:adenine/guanine phosphoribosyltransferase-like PRPP-binding protein